MTQIPNLPAGWIQPTGAAYAKVSLDFAEGGSVYAEPGDPTAPIETNVSGYLTVAEAEELIRRLSEAVAICKAAGR